MRLLAVPAYRIATLALVSSRIRSSRALLLGTLQGSDASMPSINSEGSEHCIDEEVLVESTPTIQILHLKHTVESTQDEAKRLLEEHVASTSDTTNDSSLSICVMADSQRRGRGTNGRAWVATTGNLFLTCAIPTDRIPMSRITLLPLVVGMVVAKCLDEFSTIRPVVKWPNDVLVDDKKIAGTLIENFYHQRQTWWLVGIGVNVASHPEQLSSESGDHLAKPRSATCLREHVDTGKYPAVPPAVDLGRQIALDLVEFMDVLSTGDPGGVVNEWKLWAALGMPYTIRETGEKVTTVDIEMDGQLKVIGQDGQQRLLVADYFY